MLHITCTVHGDSALVIGAFDSKVEADRARIRSGRATVETMPVSMARTGSVRPDRGDSLAVMREASGLVAVANVR